MKKYISILLLLFPIITFASVSQNSIDASKEYFDIVIDGYDNDWYELNDNDKIVSLSYPEKGIEFKTVTLNKKTHNTVSNLRRDPFPQSQFYLIKLDTTKYNPDDLNLFLSFYNGEDFYYKDKNNPFYDENGNNNIFRKIIIERSIYDKLLRVDYLKSSSGFVNKYYTRSDGRYVYIEIEGSYIPAPHNYNKSVFTLLSSGKEISQAIMPMSAICGSNCPDPKDWYGHGEYAVQLSMSVQIPVLNADIGIVINSDDEIEGINAIGLAKNVDVEVMGGVIIYNSKDLNAITKGTTLATSADVGVPWGVQAVQITGGDGLNGVGVQAGFNTANDVDFVLTYGFDPHPKENPQGSNSNPSSSSNSSNSGNSSSNGFNPNYGGRGDNHHGNDNSSSHSGGRFENSDGGVGVNTPWGGR